MADILTFPSPEEPAEDVLIMICGTCEGSTFRVLSSHELECSICGSRAMDDFTGVKYDAVAVREMSYDPPVRSEFPTTDMAFERVLRMASVEGTAGLVVMNKNGMTHVWSIGADDEEDIAWYKARVDELLETLAK
jgi:hypothetical protein